MKIKSIIPMELRGSILAAGISIYSAGIRRSEKSGVSLSELFGGIDEYVRACEGLADSFMSWCDDNVDRDALDTQWLPTIHEKLGVAVLRVLPLDSWGDPWAGDSEAVFGVDECERVAEILDLPTV